MRRFRVILAGALTTAWAFAGGLFADEAATKSPGELPAEKRVARTWSEKMFSELEYDFGAVARGANVQHALTVTNPYKEEMHFDKPMHSCGPCIVPTMDRQDLKSKESALFILSLDTVHFKDLRVDTNHVSVSFDKKKYVLVRIPVTAYIRRDVSVEQRAISDSATECRLRVTYRGKDEWKIHKVRCAHPQLHSRIEEVSRANETVEYDIHLKLATPAASDRERENVSIETSDKEHSTVLIKTIIGNDLRENHQGLARP